MIKPLLPLAALSLSACATTPPPFDGDGDPRVLDPTAQCEADAAQDMLGTTASSAVGEQLLEATGARTLRWVPPRTAVTMDYRSDRLTVYYDDDLQIERITCG